MSKSKIFQNNNSNVKKGVYGLDRRWQASRLGNVAKNRGTRMFRKPKKTT
ncbi:MAG: hypothetical protein ABIF22_02845 [bacterium]